MATQIINNGATILIKNGDSSLLLCKGQIKTIDTIRNNIVRIDIGGGALHNIFIRADEVTVPNGLSNADLRDFINGLLLSTIGGGATELNQLEEIRLLNSINTGILELATKLSNLPNGGTIKYPTRIDESEAEIIYYGYAPSGSATSSPVWAIERATKNKDVIIYDWAGGTDAYDKVWDDRASLIYTRTR